MHLQKIGYTHIVDQICGLDWEHCSQDDLKAVAAAYYYFSVAFCETVEIACAHYPDDEGLMALREGECETDNLSPYPGIAAQGERMNHNEFMRRVVAMSALDRHLAERIGKMGEAYLGKIRSVDPVLRITCLASYEDGGLERVFRSVLRAQDWQEPSLLAFRHFLVGHVELDSDPEGGHGALCRHLTPDERIAPLWNAFLHLLMEAAPNLSALTV